MRQNSTYSSTVRAVMSHSAYCPLVVLLLQHMLLLPQPHGRVLAAGTVQPLDLSQNSRAYHCQTISKISEKSVVQHLLEKCRCFQLLLEKCRCFQLLLKKCRCFSTIVRVASSSDWNTSYQPLVVLLLQHMLQCLLSQPHGRGYSCP